MIVNMTLCFMQDSSFCASYPRTEMLVLRATWSHEGFSHHQISRGCVAAGENLGNEQHFRLRELLRYNLKTVRKSTGSPPA